MHAEYNGLVPVNPGPEIIKKIPKFTAISETGIQKLYPWFSVFGL